MQNLLQITFRHMQSSSALEAKVREHVGRLERFYDRIVSCHVVIEPPSAHQHKGMMFIVRVDLHLPGGDVVASSERTQRPAHVDVYVALHDAFESAKWQLLDFIRKQRGNLKRSQAALHDIAVQYREISDRIAALDGSPPDVSNVSNEGHDYQLTDHSVGSTVVFTASDGEGRSQTSSITFARENGPL